MQNPGIHKMNKAKGHHSCPHPTEIKHIEHVEEIKKLQLQIKNQINENAILRTSKNHKFT